MQFLQSSAILPAPWSPEHPLRRLVGENVQREKAEINRNDMYKRGTDCHGITLNCVNDREFQQRRLGPRLIIEMLQTPLDGA
jgi:hypothetical protein